MAGSRKKVLWVDDEIEFLRSHIMFLETRGYSVVPLFSGEDAVALIREKPHEFDIVLLDEQMPGKDGLTTLEEIKQIVPDLPVVMVTKSEEEQLMEAAIGKKINGYLTKPVNPSQILLVCKNILDAKQIVSAELKQRFVRSYSENRTALADNLNAVEWLRMYERMVRWDLELDKVDDEGLRQTHAGQKSDCNRLFSNFVIENYGTWIKAKPSAPILAYQALDRHIIPLLKSGQKVILFILSGMRLDQYTVIEQILREFYSVKRNYFFSMLPSVSSFSRSSFFAGSMPADIAARYPQICTAENDFSSDLDETLLKDKLKDAGIDCSNTVLFSKGIASSDIKSIVKKTKSTTSALVPFVFDINNFLLDNTSGMLQDLTNDESGLRELTKSWFLRSPVFSILKELAGNNYTIMLTSDHGTELCSRGTELYGVEMLGKNLRYKIGKEISTDERNALFLNDPPLFGLPKFGGGDENALIIAKENYYFVPPDKFEFYRKHYKTTFQEGGVSMEEIIMPLGIFTNRESA